MSTAFDRQRQSIMGEVVAPIEPEDHIDARYVKVVTLQTLLRALRRRKLWVWTALLGMVIGAGLHAIIPPEYAATTKLFLAEPSGVDPTQAMTNDASLLATQAVARKAMLLLRENGDVASFASSYRGVALSESILSVTSSAGSIGAAEEKVNAIAKAFLELRGQEFMTQTDITSTGIQNEIKKLQGDIGNLTTEITAASGRGTSAANTVTDLVNQRSGDESQVAQLESQLQQNSVNLAALTEGSRVLDPGFASGKSTKKVMATDGLTGLIGGLALGSMVVVVGLLLGEGVRRRDLLASILNAPVELSVGGVTRSRRVRRYRARRILKRPPTPLRMIERRLAYHLDSEVAGRLIVAEVEATDVAALAVLRTTLTLASGGHEVVLVDSAEGRPLSRLLGRSARRGRYSPTLQETVLQGQSFKLYIVPEDPAEAEIPRSDGAVVLVLVTPDPATGCSHLEGLAEISVMIVTAGRAEPERLQAAHQMLGRAGVALESAILLDADPDDQTVGLAPGAKRAEHHPGPGFSFFRTRLVGR